MTTEALAAPPSARATLATIAGDAAVSMSTVSKVLNGRPGVSDATRARVEKLLQSHGYSRRGAVQGMSPLIEIVFSELDNGWAIELIRGVERVTRENGMSVVLTESGNRHNPAPDWIDGVVRRHPVGVILVLSDLQTEHKKQLRSRNIPFVVVDPAGDPAPDVPSIGSANWAGGILATRHLIELGHRTIGVIAGPEDVMCARARVSGFRSAMEAAELPVREDLIVPGDFNIDSGTEGGLALLRAENPPTAIFATNDLQALGAYEAAQTMGMSIPDDLSIVGYDDVQFAKLARPGLTTVRQPLTEMAEEATRLVIRLRNEKQFDNLRLDLATTLVVRNSTRRIA